MPKQLHEIKRFQTGTVTTPSDRDVPEDSASYSKNLDSVTEDGKLKGIPDDKTIVQASQATGDIKFQNNPTTNHRIYLNGVEVEFANSSDSNSTPIKVKIESTKEDTIDSAVSALNQSTNSKISVATYSRDSNLLVITYDASGASGNLYTLGWAYIES